MLMSELTQFIADLGDFLTKESTTLGATESATAPSTTDTATTPPDTTPTTTTPSTTDGDTTTSTTDTSATTPTSESSTTTNNSSDIYINPGSSVATYLSQNPTVSDSSLTLLKDTPASIWLGSWSGDIWTAVNSIVTQLNGKIAVLVWYNIPNRDGTGYSAGGLANPQAYYDWAGAGAAAVETESVINILEPDALGLSSSLTGQDLTDRFSMLNSAAKALHKNNSKVYIDASMYVAADTMAGLVKQVENLDGFSLNVSGYTDLTDCITYGEQLSSLTDLNYVIDTSRNGNGNPHSPMWCNVTDTKIGDAPTLSVDKTTAPHCDAYLWIKVPGESDGLGINDDGTHPLTDVPAAGTFWPDYADAIVTGNWATFNTKYSVQ
jgi:endoglucanase